MSTPGERVAVHRGGCPHIDLEGPCTCGLADRLEAEVKAAEWGTDTEVSINAQVNLEVLAPQRTLNLAKALRALEALDKTVPSLEGKEIISTQGGEECEVQFCLDCRNWIGEEDPHSTKCSRIIIDKALAAIRESENGDEVAGRERRTDVEGL